MGQILFWLRGVAGSLGYAVLALHMAVPGCRRPALTNVNGTHPPQLWRPSDRGESQNRTLHGIVSNKTRRKVYILNWSIHNCVRSITFIGIILITFVASIAPRGPWFSATEFKINGYRKGLLSWVLRFFSASNIPPLLLAHMSFILPSTLYNRSCW